MSFAKPVLLLLALVAVAPAVQAADISVSAESRCATFENAGKSYFALSVLPSESGNYPPATSLEVVVLFDTSASQTGEVRIEALEVLEELAATLPLGSSLSLMACDVRTVPMSDGFVSPADTDWEDAVGRLKQRAPLGTTNLGLALRTANKQFGSSDAQRTIVYIGDGINRSNLLRPEQFQQLVRDLKSAKATVSSFITGPVVELSSLAALANQTGGILLSRNEINESMQAVGRSLGLSAAMPVMWVENATLPSAFANYFPQEVPPLRVDRDTILVGELNGTVESAEVEFTARANGQAVTIATQVNAEDSNPDMGFLTAVVAAAEKDGGASLPALGSAGLRALSFAYADNASSMAKSGEFVLRSGRTESAIRIAEEALKSDPNNAEAAALLKAARESATHGGDAGEKSW